MVCCSLDTCLADGDDGLAVGLAALHQSDSLDGVTEAELQDAKTYLTGAYPLRFDGNGPIANIAVGMQREGLPIDYIATRNDQVMAVTLDDVNRVARELMDPDRLTFVVVGQPEGLMDKNDVN